MKIIRYRRSEDATFGVNPFSFFAIIHFTSRVFDARLAAILTIVSFGWDIVLVGTVVSIFLKSGGSLVDGSPSFSNFFCVRISRKIAEMSLSSGRGALGLGETLIRAILAKDDDILEIDSSFVEIADVSGISDFKDFSSIGVNSAGKGIFLDVVPLATSYF